MGLWQEQRRGSAFPSLEDMNSGAINDVLPDCFTVHVADPCTFQHLGEVIATQSGLLTNDLSMSQVPDRTLLSAALRGFGQVLESRVPLGDTGEFEDAKGHRYLFRSILLPLSDDQQSIDFVLGGARCKIVPQNS